MLSLLYSVYLLVYFKEFHPSGLGKISGGRVGCGFSSDMGWLEMISFYMVYIFCLIKGFFYVVLER